jgi:ADP-ribose pyrophosphatase YjhB (NUDIX family)
VTVAAVVMDQGRLLLIEESIEGNLVLNQPAGHLEPGESLIEAVVRETLEESGWTIRPTDLIGIYQWKDDDQSNFIRFAFAAEPLSHDPTRALDQGIVRTLWMTPTELQATSARHRSREVWRAVADYLIGIRQPLDMLHYRS